MSATTPMSAARPGEQLDVVAVDAWLRHAIPDLAPGLPEVTQYSGGASNWTYRFRYPTRDLVLRRPPAGTKAKSAHDMAREFHIQQALKPVFPAVPTVVALCQDQAVIGCDFYVMDRVDGLIPRAPLPTGLALGPDQARRLCTAWVDALVDLHAVDPRAAGLDALGRGPGYARRQVEGWSDRYLRARTWNVPTFARVRAWLHAHVPEDIAACVIHNDWRLDNVVVDPADPARIVGVLDWEMATIGDPLMDLGSALAYWVHADDPWLLRVTRRQPSDLPGMLRLEDIVARYLDRTGRRPADWRFYEVFGLFRLAVIVQQIYFRYHHRQTRNPAFRHFWVLVHAFDRRCRRLMTGRP